LVSFAISAIYVKRLKIPRVASSWRETLDVGRVMFGMGIAFMWNGVVSAAVAMASRAIIVRDLGLAQNGIFQATWTLSGMFATFLLAAMSSDFYPRLSAASEDRGRMNELVNQQTEIGIILALPALLLTLALAPWILVVFYNREFLAGSHLLPWLVLGVFLQVVSWPLGFIQMAKGQSRRYIVSQTLFNICHLALVVLLMERHGLVGVGIALPAVYAVYTSCMLVYCRIDNGFLWSRGVTGLLSLSALAILISHSVSLVADGLPAVLGRVAVGLIAGYFSLRALARRLPESHRLRQLLSRFRLIPAYGR
jgi:PST family polysaccharide transporter